MQNNKTSSTGVVLGIAILLQLLISQEYGNHKMSCHHSAFLQAGSHNVRNLSFVTVNPNVFLRKSVFLEILLPNVVGQFHSHDWSTVVVLHSPEEEELPPSLP